MPRFPIDERRVALIVIPTVARPKVLIPAFARLLQHLDGLPVHICVSINAVDQADGDESQRQVLKLWQSYAEEGVLPTGCLLTVYRHPGPCGFGGALNRGILAAATDEWVVLDEEGNVELNEDWPADMHRLKADGEFDSEQPHRVDRRYDNGSVSPSDPAQLLALDNDEHLPSPGLPPLTIFYNDDLEAADGWLVEMIAAVDPTRATICDIGEPVKGDGKRNPRPMALYGKVGLVGPVTNLAAGMQCLVNESKDWRKVGTDRFAAEWRKNNAGLLMTADFLSGFCMGITRDCLEALWGANPDRDGPYLFDEQSYPIAGYEDNDLCVRVAEAGYRAAIAAGGFVGHIGHQSFDALFPDMQRGMRNRQSYYRKWAPWVRSRAGKLVASLRVKIEVPNDLRLLRPTLNRLGQLVDGVAILFTNDPAEALTHEEGVAEVKSGEIPQEDLLLLRALAHPNVRASGQKRAERIQTWIKARLSEATDRKPAGCAVGFWPTDRPMNERDERNAAISMAERMGADWIWAIDHDEVVEPRIQRAHLDRWMTHPDPLVGSLDQGFYTTWDTVRMYRLDRPWGDEGRMVGGMRGWRLWRVNKRAPGRILAGTDNGLHCGNSPTSDPMTKRHMALRIHHHGYLRAEDRARKTARYDRQDPNPDPSLVGGGDYNHLTYEERVTLSAFAPRNGIGFHMLVHAGEDPGGVMSVLDQVHTLADAGVLVWTSPTDAPERSTFAEIAALFGVGMVDHPIDPERGGLGDARNYGIHWLAETESRAHLGMGWTLFMDPDEQLPDSASISIRRLADATDCWGWIFRYVNPYLKGGASESESVRMVRLHPEMRMDGRVHEGFGEATRRLKARGFGDILRTAPFTSVNLGLRCSDEQLQAKHDRYFRWACKAITDGERRLLNWTTIGLYFAHEGLWKAPERCFARAVAMDADSFLAANLLSTHYLRMARGPAALAGSRLSEGHPLREHMERVVAFCEEEAPAITGMGMVGKGGRESWTEARANALLDLLEGIEDGLAAERATVAPSERQTLIDTMKQDGASDARIDDALTDYDSRPSPGPVESMLGEPFSAGRPDPEQAEPVVLQLVAQVEQEDDGTPE